MALDRSSIEKKDFPSVRQGYDKGAVDAHLAAIADEFEHLTLASSASERVRAIVEAAETSAAQIQREADDAARATLEEAEQAARHAREGAGKVSELAAALTRELDESRRQLEALVGSLPGAEGAAPQSTPRTEARVYPDPASAEPDAGPTEPPPAPASSSEVSSSSHAERPPAPGAAQPPSPMAEQPPAPGAAQPPSPMAEQPPGPMAEQPPTDVTPPPAADTENARLIALNMALDGRPRDQTAKYLDENFQLADRDRLLDEVYSSVEG